jgi:hypothetical protein
MTKPDVLMVPATSALVEAFYGRPPIWTMRGHVALIEDRVVGVGGISYEEGLPILFSDAAPELRARRRDMVRGVRLLERQARAFRGTLFAIAGTGETAAPRLLGRLGFKPTEMPRLMVREL